MSPPSEACAGGPHHLYLYLWRACACALCFECDAGSGTGGGCAWRRGLWGRVAAHGRRVRLRSVGEALVELHGPVGAFLAMRCVRSRSTLSLSLSLSLSLFSQTREEVEEEESDAMQDAEIACARRVG